MPLNNLVNLISNLERFSFEKEQQKVIEDNEQILADLQAEQWAESRDSTGEKIRLLDNPEYGYGYRPFTIEHKIRYGGGLGSITSRVTLFQTGELYSSLFFKVESGMFFLNSKQDYFSSLMQRTEADGLDYEQRLKFAESVLMPEIKKVFKQITGLQIT